MHIFNFSLFTMLISCIALIGAVPIWDRAPAEAIGRQLYVPGLVPDSSSWSF
jgi:hypothetical protein